jgi:CrcB protein
VVLGFVVGASTAAAAPHWVQLLIGTGFCGALTTYSTFSYETLRLYEQNAKLAAAANLTASILAALGAAYLGQAVAQAIWHA